MAGLLSGINTALQALLTQQQVLNVVEHNVANANTEGYTRQTAILSATAPHSPAGMDSGFSAGQIGSGVEVTHISRHTLEFVNNRLREENSTSSQWETTSLLLGQVEFTLAEQTDDGMTQKISEFWNSWLALASEPGNNALRADLVERTGNLTQSFNRRAQSLTEFRQDQNLSIRQRALEINSIGTQIAKLNNEIMAVTGAGMQPNDMLDRVDLLLNRLSELGGVRADTQSDGSVMVSMGGHALVVGTTSFSLSTVADPLNDNLHKIEWEDGLDFISGNGELKAIYDTRDIYVVDQMDALDTFAATLIARVNAVHNTGFSPNNATGLDVFTGTDALTIRVSANFDDLNNIANAAAINSPGDNAIADQIANIQNEMLLDGGTSTFSDFYLKEIAGLGLLIERADNLANERGSVAAFLKAQKESVSGVSLDEEATALMQAQHAYNAAARLMTTIDEMLDRIINRMGRVGL